MPASSDTASLAARLKGPGRGPAAEWSRCSMRAFAPLRSNGLRLLRALLSKQSSNSSMSAEQRVLMSSSDSPARGEFGDRFLDHVEVSHRGIALFPTTISASPF